MQTDPVLALACGLGGLLLCWSTIPVVRFFALRYGWTIRARAFHHTHTAAVPRLGGIGFGLAFLVVGGLALLVASPERFQMNLTLILTSLAMLAMGLWDDFRPLGARKKLIAQVLIAWLAFLGGLHIDWFRNPLTGHAINLGMWGLPVTVFWLVAVTNLINLVDGIDGLAGGIALMLLVLLAFFGAEKFVLPTLVAAGMAGALIAFLRFNFPPATIYMGDGGAYFLGFLIGSLTIVTSNKGTVAAAMVAPLFALALPILDVSLAILRRGSKGLPFFRPDRQHIHHKLIRKGFSQRRVVLMLYGLTAICSVMALAVFYSQGRLLPVLVGALFIILLLSASMFGLIGHLGDLPKSLDVSLQLRKDSRYALAIADLLEMEAERSETLQELWLSYVFMMRRLGFSQVRLFIAGQDHALELNLLELNKGSPVHRSRQELLFANIQAFEFIADKLDFSEESFDQLSELAAEAWLKAAQAWKTHHDTYPVRFAHGSPPARFEGAPGEVFISSAA
jgi:UDP-GlcNAc:undecaprenyl-phosphate GlcNAc-1-phosphate transferase